MKQPFNQQLLKNIVLFFTLNLISFSLYAETNIKNMELQYSLLHRTGDEKNTVALESGENVKNNDEIKINVQFDSTKVCYIIYKGATDEISILYNSATDSAPKVNPFFYGTSWYKLSPPLGDETLYLLLTNSRLDVIEKLISDYSKSQGGRAKKFIKRFIAEMEKLKSPEKIVNLASRLDKPVVGGVSFRGKDDEKKLNSYSLTHNIKGPDTDILFKEIILKHD
jgi:hypothetical protein